MKTLRDFCTLFLVICCICSVVFLSYADDPQGELNTDATADSQSDELGADVVLLESKVEQLTTTVYCYCGCTRETIQHCVCGTAAEVETEFRNRLEAGETVEQIREDYLKAYGSQYSAVLPVGGFNTLAYVMPAIILILLGGGVFFILKSKTATKPASVTEENRAISEERSKEIEEEVQRHTQQR